MGSSDTLTEEVVRLRTAHLVSLRPHDVRATGQSHLTGMLEFIDLGLATVDSGLHQSRTGCFHKEVLQREVNALVSEAPPYFKSDKMPSGCIPVIILVE